MTLEKLYTEYKGHLMRIAYRMLGSIIDAEDMVQEVFSELARRDLTQITHIRTYLTKMTINRCINLLQSSSRTREQYIGPWLPEPLLDQHDLQPDRLIEKEEHLRYALLVILQKLTPQERALLIFKDMLDYRYDEIANMLEISEVNCRKIRSRANQKLKKEQFPTMSQPLPPKFESFVQRFIAAMRSGAFDPLIEELVEEVTLMTDGGGKRKAAYHPIYGITRVLAFLNGIYGKGVFAGELRMIKLVDDIGIELSHEGMTRMTIHFHCNEQARVSYIYIMLNPEKLRAVK